MLLGLAPPHSHEGRVFGDNKDESIDIDKSVFVFVRKGIWLEEMWMGKQRGMDITA